MPESASTSLPEISLKGEVRDLFLSYNSADRLTVLKIKQSLQERGISTFLDRHDLVPGTNWFDALEHAIQGVRAVAVFIGANGFGSWQKKETQLALDRQTDDDREGKVFPVIPVVLPQANIDKVSGFLLLNTWIDLRDGHKDASIFALAEAIRGVRSPQLRSAQHALCPYRALRPFREEDEAFFFGREVFTKELFEKVLQYPIVTLVGPSGSGKSSLVQAGLLPLLRRQKPPAHVWDSVVFTPGERAFHKLAAALVPLWETNTTETNRLIAAEDLGTKLASGSVSIAAAIDLAIEKSQGIDRLLLVVDQFEELFRQTSEAEASTFISSLLKAASSRPVTIVLTLRADFYGQAIFFDRALSDALQPGLFNLGAMNKGELESSIVKPAHQVGLEFESGLVNRILNDVLERPANLPLLEFALTELWERRKEHLLTNAAYDEIGGAPGALTNRAEEQFEKLSPPQQKTLLGVLTRLIRFAAADEEGRDTRRRLKRETLSIDEQEILAKFVDARLIVSDRDEVVGDETVEFAHESLIHLWPRLRELLEKDREFLMWRQGIGFRLNEWLQKGRDKGLLLSSVLLKEARRVARDRGKDLNALEREYIRESDGAIQRPKRRLAAALAVAAIVSLTYVAWYFYVRTDFHQVRVALSEGHQLARATPRLRGEWAQTLILSGRIEEGLALTTGLDSESAKLAVLTPAADALARVGKIDESRKLAFEAFTAAALDETSDDNSQGSTSPLEDVSDLLVKRFQVEDIVEAGDQIANPEAKVRVLMGVATAFDKKGKKNEATQVIAKLLPSALMTREASTLSSTLVKASELLAKAEPEEAKRVANEALQAARKIEDPNDRASAIGAVAEALFKIGDSPHAKQVTEEAMILVRDSKDISHQSMTMMFFSEALVRSGKAGEAIEIMSGLENLVSKTTTVPVIFSTMVENGMSTEALAAAEKFDETSQYMIYTMIALALADNGKTDAALDAARKVKDEQQRSGLIAQLAWVLAIKDDTDLALQLARSVENSDARPMALMAIAYAMAKSQKIREAITTLRNIEIAEVRLMAFSMVMDELLRHETREGMMNMIAEGQDIATQLKSNDMRCSILTMIGNAQAKLGEYREARQTIEPCTISLLKLDVYSAILLEYAKDQSSNNAKIIEEFQKEEQDDN